MFIFDDDLFSYDEYMHCKRIIKDMAAVPWIQPLLRKIRDLDYPKNSKELKSALFELEIAYEFFKLNIDLEHEYNTGIGLTDVDFRFNSGDINCLIEAVSIKISDEFKEATAIKEITPGLIEYETMLGGDEKASLGHEMIKVQGKILEKACNKKGDPIKFPIPQQTDLHIVAVDVRSFDGNNWDYLQIAYGPKTIPDYCRLTYCQKFVMGIFEKVNDDIQARVFRERIHIIVFCNFHVFDSPLFSEQNCYFCWNPWLFRDVRIVKKMIASVPAFSNYPSEKL